VVVHPRSTTVPRTRTNFCWEQDHRVFFCAKGCSKTTCPLVTRTKTRSHTLAFGEFSLNLFIFSPPSSLLFCFMRNHRVVLRPPCRADAQAHNEAHTPKAKAECCVTPLGTDGLCTVGGGLRRKSISWVVVLYRVSLLSYGTRSLVDGLGKRCRLLVFQTMLNGDCSTILTPKLLHHLRAI